MFIVLTISLLASRFNCLADRQFRLLKKIIKFANYKPFKYKNIHMRKISFILLILCFTLSLSAQSNYDDIQSIPDLSSSIDLSKIQFGIKVSPAVSWLDVSDNDLQAEGATLKFSIGGIAEYPIASFLSFVSGVNFNKFGGYVLDNYSLNNPLIKDYYKLNYTEIEVPLLLKLQTKSIYKTSYFIQAGISAGFITSSNEKYYSVEKNAAAVYENIDVLTNPSRVGYQFGAGLSYALGDNTSIFGLITYKNTPSNIAQSHNYENRTYTGTNNLEQARYLETTPVTPVQIFPGVMEFSFGIMF